MSDEIKKYYCADCGAEMNEGERKTFTCCEVCWGKHYAKQKQVGAEAGVINFGADYNGNLLKTGDRVKSVYHNYEPDNVGIITKDGFIIYDDEPETEYQVLDSRYLIKLKSIKHL